MPWPLKAYVWTEERRAKARARNLGRKFSEEHKQKIAAALKGKRNSLGHKQTIEHRRKVAEYWAVNRERHNHYVDGGGLERSRLKTAERQRIEYRLWREAVFKRDNWVCVGCGQRGVKLHADHIKPWSVYPEFRYDVNNGRTMCVSCHVKTPTYGAKCWALIRETKI